MSATQTQPLELIVSVKGEIIKSNFDDFETYALQQLESINTDLNTDEDFGKAAADEKALKDAESKFKQVEAQILAEMDAVSDLIKRTRGLGEKYSKKRLALGKELRNRKAEIIEGIKSDAFASISIRHPQAIARISEAMKGKRTLESLKKHATAEAVKIEAEVQRAREIVKQYREEHGEDVCYDEHKLLVMEAGLIEAELSRRVERKAAALKEAELKAEAEKAKAEKESAERQAEWERREAEVKSEELGNDPPPIPASPPPKIDSIPVGRSAKEASETPEEEMARFLATVEDAFAPVKAARSGLKHTENIRHVGMFAKHLGEAWRLLLVKSGNEFREGGADE